MGLSSRSNNRHRPDKVNTMYEFSSNVCSTMQIKSDETFLLVESPSIPKRGGYHNWKIKMLKMLENVFTLTKQRSITCFTNRGDPGGGSIGGVFPVISETA